MKLFRSIIALTLLVAFLNVIVGKAVHELFFHHHEIECSAKTTQHFHGTEFNEVDLICSFNFSASLNPFFASSFNHQLFEVEKKTLFLNESTNQNTYFNTLSLRGPPQLV